MSARQDVCIVTDSNADIPREFVEALDITVVPLSFVIDGETYFDGDLTLEEFFVKMNASKELPKTSQPPVGAFREAFKSCLERYSEVVCMTTSNRLSGTFESATEAAREFGDRVHILDTLNLSWGEGCQVLDAARTAATGASVEAIKKRWAEYHKGVHIIVGLDSVDNIAKGGRIGRVAALLGGLLKLRITITVAEDGTFDPVAKVRGAMAGLQGSVDWIATKIDASRPCDFGIQHALSPDKAAWLEEAIRARFTVGELLHVPAGAVISCHTGTGWGITAIQL